MSPPAAPAWRSTARRRVAQSCRTLTPRPPVGILWKPMMSGRRPLWQPRTGAGGLEGTIAKGRAARRATRGPAAASTFDERQDVGVHDVGVGGGHAVRKALIDLQRAVFQELHR